MKNFIKTFFKNTFIFSKNNEPKIPEVIEIPEDKLWYCIFTWNKIFFDINKPYKDSFSITNKELWEHCHFSWNKWLLWDSSVLKPIFYENYQNALTKYWKEKCIPDLVLDGLCYEPNIRWDYYSFFKSLVYEELKGEIKPIFDKFKQSLIKSETVDTNLLKNRAIADVLRKIDNYFYSLNENFSFFKAINENYNFTWFYKYVIKILNDLFDNQIKFIPNNTND